MLRRNTCLTYLRGVTVTQRSPKPHDWGSNPYAGAIVTIDDQNFNSAGFESLNKPSNGDKADDAKCLRYQAIGI